MTGAGGDKEEEIRVIARYTLHGVTEEYSKTVTLVDLDLDDDGLLNDAEAYGWVIDWRECDKPTANGKKTQIH